VLIYLVVTFNNRQHLDVLVLNINISVGLSLLKVILKFFAVSKGMCGENIAHANEVNGCCDEG
jgi:hypothetical protein